MIKMAATAICDLKKWDPIRSLLTERQIFASGVRCCRNKKGRESRLERHTKGKIRGDELELIPSAFDQRGAMQIWDFLLFFP